MPRQLEIWPGENKENNPFRKADTLIKPDLGISIRLAFLHCGNLALLKYKKTSWYGLPGGNINPKELRNQELMDPAVSFPVIKREIREECKVDVSGLMKEIRFVGLTDYVTVDQTKKRAFAFASVIWAVVFNETPTHQRILSLLRNNPSIYFFRIKGPHGQKKIFPDARETIVALKTKENLAGFLNNGAARSTFFSMKPKLGPLWSAPEWMRTQ